uniref:Uncharacterized protein n=1 Tax=Arundo donax TaxID=35708 RepID=A0A0A8Z6E3_ARUDO
MDPLMKTTDHQAVRGTRKIQCVGCATGGLKLVRQLSILWRFRGWER